MDAYPQIMLDLAGGHSRILKLSTNPRRCSGAGSSWKCSEVTHLRREVAGESMKAGFGRSSSEDVRRASAVPGVRIRSLYLEKLSRERGSQRRA